MSPRWRGQALSFFLCRDSCFREPQGLRSGVGSRAHLSHDRADVVLQLLYAFASDCRDGEKWVSALFAESLYLRELLWIGNVHLGGDHDHRLLREAGAEAYELIHDDFEVVDGVRAAAGIGDINHVQQQPGTFDVAEELNAEAVSAVRAFDEAGDVSNDIAFLFGQVADADHAQVGLEGGEFVISDLGAGGGDARY